ncbi:MAG: right-handed parallel beta-helix repeat-containing protein [Thermodesulfobacteriota bacterium]|nr:right-handed parallel beta-helix repeat-containing protein [Thermodesulfobacteriota bacterium]
MASARMFKTICSLFLTVTFFLTLSSCTFFKGIKLNDYEQVAAVTNTIWANIYFKVKDIKIPGYDYVMYKNTHWRKKDSPVVIDGSLYIFPGVLLTIDPGVTVRLAGDALVTCRGIVDARGTAGEPITFTWKDADKPWDAIEFVNAIGQKDSPDKVMFHHCVIEHGGGITINTSTTHVANCEFRYNVGTPLKLEYSGGIVENNTFHDNSTQAQAAAGNGGGINVYSDKTVLVRANEIFHNQSHGGRDGGGGIYAFAYNEGDISVFENTVRENKSDRKAGGIYGYNAKIIGNLVECNWAEKTGGGIHAIQSLVEDNVVLGNNAPVGGGVYSESCRVIHNLVRSNRSPEGAGIFHSGDGRISRNTLLDNFSHGSAKSSAITISGNPIVDYNNIIVPDDYALTFRSHTLTPDLKARHNYWGASDTHTIERLIFDWLEDSDLGLVNFKDYQKIPIADAYPLPANARQESVVVRADEAGLDPVMIRGLIDHDTVLGDDDINTYTVFGNMLVKEGVRLTVMPGTRLFLKKDASIRVRGVLAAAGEAGSPIGFSGSPEAPWGNIIFENRSLDLEAKAVQTSMGEESLLRHCIVENSSGIVMDGQGGDILNSVIQGTHGTGIRIKEVSMTVKDCKIRDNVSESDGGGIYVYGSKRVLIHNNEIVNNRAADGGGMFAYGYRSNAAVDIRQNHLSGNVSDGDGGGLWVSRCSVVDNTISDNTTENQGGGVYTSFALIHENRISGNTATDGGGLYAEANSTINGNTMVDNRSLSGMGGGAYINFWGLSMHNKTMAHNVIENNRVAVADGTGGVCTKGELTFGGNIIQNNDGWELKNLSTNSEPDLSAPLCYWGSTSSAEIASYIYDGEDDPTLSVVDYSGFAKTESAALGYVIPEEDN